MIMIPIKKKLNNKKQTQNLMTYSQSHFAFEMPSFAVCFCVCICRRILSKCHISFRHLFTLIPFCCHPEPCSCFLSTEYQLGHQR